MTRVLSSAPRRSSDESTRPICASVWVRKPAKTSCWRASMRRSSAEQVVPGLHPFGACGEHGAVGHDARGDLAGEHLVRARRPSPCRTRPGRGRPTRAPRGAAHAWRRARSTGRRACRAPPAAGPAPCGRPGRPGPRSGGSPPRAGGAARRSGCRRPGSGPSGWCRPGGSRSSARSRGRAARCRTGPAAERCQRGVRCHFPTASVE